MVQNCETASLTELVACAENAPARYVALATIANVSLQVAQRLVRYGGVGWEDEIGMRRLINTIIDTNAVASSDVHASRWPDAPADPVLSTAGETLQVALGASVSRAECKKRLAEIAGTYDHLTLLQVLPTVAAGIGPHQRRLAAQWATELLWRGNADNETIAAYLRCTGWNEEPE